MDDKAAGKARRVGQRFKNILPSLTPRHKKTSRGNGDQSGSDETTFISTSSNSVAPGADDFESKLVLKTNPSQMHTETEHPELCPISELWNQAYEDLRSGDDKKLIEKYEAIIETELSAMVASTAAISSPALIKALRKENMKRILERKVTEVKDNKWRLRFNDHELAVEEIVQPVIDVIDWADKYVSDALSANPYASIAWAGVSLILPAASMAAGLKNISNLIVQSSIREALYIHRYESDKNERMDEALVSTHASYRDELRKLYALILKFQAGCICYYYRGTAARVLSDLAKWDGWDDASEEIKAQNEAFQAIYELMKDVMSQEDYNDIYQQHLKSTTILQSVADDMSDLLKAIKTAGEDKARLELLKWLSEVNPSTNYNTLIEKPGISAADWFFKDEKVLQWEREECSLLWLNGKVGSGKSVLRYVLHISQEYCTSSSDILRCVMAIKWLGGLHRNNPKVAIAYWYFSFNAPQKQNVHAMLRSLTKQLLCCRPDTPEVVKSLESYRESGHDPELAKLEETLGATIRGFAKVYFIIDALDECPKTNRERERLLESLERVLERCPPSVHMLWTSREEPDIDHAFKELRYPAQRINFELATRQAAINWGIGIYINDFLAKSSCKTWPDYMKIEVREALIKKADGMFQYVSLQLEAIQELRRPQEIRDAIQGLPEGLDGTYERILTAVKPKYQKQVVSMLKWLCFSYRPLHIEELAEILILDPEANVPFDYADKLFNEREVLGYLPSILEETFDRPSRYLEDEEPALKLAHFSIQEYLLSEKILEGSAKAFHIDERDAHTYIMDSCLSYHLHLSINVRYGECLGSIMWHEFKLWDYVQRNWHKHLEFIVKDTLPAPIARKIRQLFIKDSWPWLNMIRSKDDFANSPLLYATECSMVWLVEYLINNGLAIDNGSALEQAVWKNKEDIVVMLVEGGANVNKLDSGNASLLQKACGFSYNGQHLNERVVRILLEHGADVNANEGYLGSALQKAAGANADNIVRILLDQGATDIGTALQNAAGSNHDKIILTLLEYGADINYQGGYYGTALQAACASGHESTVRLLLDSGAKIDTEGGGYHTALHAAAQHSYEDIVCILLDRGANVSIKGWPYGYAIHNAIITFQEAAKKLRLASGPSSELVNNVAKSGRTVKLLASRGARPLPDTEWLERQERVKNSGALQRFQDDSEAYLASISRYLGGKESINIFVVVYHFTSYKIDLESFSYLP